MPRIARVVVPDVPHHVTQRGNRKQRTFFRESDYRLYKDLLGEWCSKYGVQIWAYCLMPNHVHLILTPLKTESLARAVGETHRRYTVAVNSRRGWTGYLWQGRFASFPMDDAHVWNATRYVLTNPVRAGLVRKAIDWPHSSARAHLRGKTDGLVNIEHLQGRIGNWGRVLASGSDAQEMDAFRLHQRSGRPLGSDGFLRRLETLLDRDLSPRRPGRPRLTP